jgi:hypothetical protein
LSRASTSVVRSLSGKQSRTPPRQNSEGRDRRQRDYHLTPYFLVRPPMSGPWGPPPMMYQPCPPRAGWYRLWAPPPMHFHLGWSGLGECFGHGEYYTVGGRYGSVGHQQDKGAQDSKTGQSEMQNWTIKFPQRQQLLQDDSTGSGCPRMDLLLMDQEASRERQGRGVRLRPMMKQSPT